MSKTMDDDRASEQDSRVLYMVAEKDQRELVNC